MMKKKNLQLEELKSHESNILKAFNIKGRLALYALPGGIANSPILAKVNHNSTFFPLGVFKRENSTSSNIVKRFNSIDLMRKSGFLNQPRIIKNITHQYITLIGSNKYSLIEYIYPDKNINNASLSIFTLLKLTAYFHQHSYFIPNTKSWVYNKFHNYLKNCIIFHSEVLQLLSSLSINKTECETILKLNEYFHSNFFANLISQLPSQVIIGDNHQDNIIFSNQKGYFIDFDQRRYDLRLYDLVSIISCGHDNIQQQFIYFLSHGQWFDILTKYYDRHVYNPLLESEKKFFNLILAFSILEIINWSLIQIERLSHLNDTSSVLKFKKMIKSKLFLLNILGNNGFFDKHTY